MILDIQMGDIIDTPKSFHKTPDLIHIFNATEDVYTLPPHWQTMGFLNKMIKKAQDLDNMWIGRLTVYLRVICKTKIHKVTSFIDSDNAIQYHEFMNHLKNTREGILLLQEIPGYPDIQNQRFKDQFDFIFMQMEGITHKANDINITFQPKTLLSDIASKKAVRIDISESIKGVENQYDMLHSLLSWVMTNIDNHDDRVYIKTLHDLALHELPLDLKIQMAIKGITIE